MALAFASSSQSHGQSRRLKSNKAVGISPTASRLIRKVRLKVTTGTGGATQIAHNEAIFFHHELFHTQ